MKALFLLLLVSYSYSVIAKTGGHCRYVDYKMLAKVVDADSKDIIVKTANAPNNRIQIQLSKFKQPAVKNDFVIIHVREHTSGGCSPYDIQRVSQLIVANIDFNPDPGHLYQAAFAAAELSGCSTQPQCAEKNSAINFLTARSLTKLQSLLPKTLTSCPIELLEKHLESIKDLNMKKRIIACANTEADGEVLLEFMITESITKGNPVELSKIY